MLIAAGQAVLSYLTGVGGAVVDGVVALGGSCGNFFMKLIGA